jgi:hypothetical protein
MAAAADVCDPMQFALGVAQISDKLAQLHRGVVAGDGNEMCDAAGTSTKASSSSQTAQRSCGAEQLSQASARQLQIAKLAERIAVAAESLAQSQKKAAARESQKASKQSATSTADMLKLTSLVARDARKAADRQARCSVVPQAAEIEALAPEWVQQQLRKQLGVSSGSELEFVCAESDRRTVPLTCPLSGVVLKVPVRGQDCQHIDCFDLESFRRSATAGWRCPMIGCTSSVAPELLRRDSFLEAVLSQAGTSSRTISLGLDLAAVKTSGSADERAKTLASHALLAPSQRKSNLSVESVVLGTLKEATATIEIEDSDTEVSPKAKRCRRSSRHSSLGGA